MHLMRESWTDERLDDFRGEVGHRFDEVDRRFSAVDKRFDEIDKRFDKVDERFEKVDQRFERIEGELREFRTEVHDSFMELQRVIMRGTMFLSGSFVAAFAALIGLVATQM